jgi:hypothetical protein
MINVFNAVLNYNIVLPVQHRMYVINVTTILLILLMEHVHNAELKMDGIKMILLIGVNAMIS